MVLFIYAHYTEQLDSICDHLDCIISYSTKMQTTGTQYNVNFIQYSVNKCHNIVDPEN